MLTGKTFLITGGTGSFGQTLVSRLLKTNVEKIIVFSRDEAKQHFMKQDFSDPRIEYVLGDVRNIDSIEKAISGVDFVFHAAALKQVPASEASPWEFVQTNVIGSQNLLTVLSKSSVNKAVFLSTDKAVYPLNTMGMTKALMEKLVRSDFASSQTNTVITRYGNVIGSRGSVIPQFIESIQKTNSVKITDPKMTRFMMSLNQSVELVLFALENGEPGDLFVQKSPAATVDTVVQALGLLMNKTDIEIEQVGIRPGEKIHETLLSSEERDLAIEHDLYFQVPKLRLEMSTRKITHAQHDDYTSQSTHQLNKFELAELLDTIPYIRASLSKLT
jgi:UDP-glucose 4-epimerase